jgi:hypothetical protein
MGVFWPCESAPVAEDLAAAESQRPPGTAGEEAVPRCSPGGYALVWVSVLSPEAASDS